MPAASMVSSRVEAASSQASGQGVAAEVERSPGSATSLLLATDACCQAGHVIAEVEPGGGEMPVLACVTCTEQWGRRAGLRSWQERCPSCFAEAYPRGLTDRDLGITARQVV